jgi:hypothetical protein
MYYRQSISMTPLIRIAVLCSILASQAAAQTPSGSDGTVLVYHAVNSIKAPELRPTDFTPILSRDCKYYGTGSVRVSLFVDSQGKPQNVATFFPPFGDNYDRMALAIARVDHFVPGTKDGVPVAVAQDLEIKVVLCTVDSLDESGKPSELLRIKSLPVQRLLAGTGEPPKEVTLTLRGSMQSSEQPKLGFIGGGISAPIPLVTPPLEYPRDLTVGKTNGRCLISLVIDANGVPQVPRVIQGINEVLDQKALENIAKYRFKPAMKGNERVPVRITIEQIIRFY